VLAYDYTVLAGTQGNRRPLQEGPDVRADRADAPCRSFFFAEGGGGPARATRTTPSSALCRFRAFALWAKLSGQVPRGLHRRRQLLRRQTRVISGCSESDRRHGELLARDGGPGDDRGAEASGRVPRRRDVGSGRDAGAKRGCWTSSSRTRREGRRHDQAPARLLPRAGPRIGSAADQAALRERRCPRAPGAPTTSRRRSCARSPTLSRSRRLREGLRAGGWSRRWSASKDAPQASIANNCKHQARSGSPARPRTRPTRFMQLCDGVRASRSSH